MKRCHSRGPRRPLPALVLALGAFALLSSIRPAFAHWLTLANPDWSITLTDAGYSDFLLDNTPGFEGREYLSGEWGGAVGYQRADGAVVSPQWLEPNFVFPDAASGWVLHESTGLSPASWADSPRPVNVVGSQKQVTISPPTGSGFFRLAHP